MSAPAFTPIGSFSLPPPAANIPVLAHPTVVHPFVGPIPADSCLGLLYQQAGGKKIVRIPHKTLRAASKTGTDGMPYFDANPTSCADCARPFYPHNGAGFTILFQCPHWPDDSDPVWANEEIDLIIPDPPPRAKRQKAPLGNVVVVKHETLGWEAASIGPTASTVFSARLANVTPDDVSAIDGALALLNAHRLGWRYFVEYEAAERLHWATGGNIFPLDLAPCVFQDLQLKGPEGQWQDLSRPPPMAPCSASLAAASRHPCVIAQASIFSTVSGDNGHDHDDHDDHVVLVVVVVVVTARTWHDQGRVFVCVSPKVGDNVSLAASAQHTPGGSAVALRKNKRPRSKFAAYAVIRGREIGVQTSWSKVQELITDFRFALQFGCKSVADAQALVAFASAKKWTSTDAKLISRPVALESVPLPCTSASDLAGRPTRKERDPWYICYVGIHPGVYLSYLECALNTLGVPGNVHDHRDTFEAALEEFMWAELDGNVLARDS
ncbi:hypothetical protein C8F01DRAFT_1265412 [Mycena amicta]|nr:hypothetical protein C8F01DRAFT_1265412 [Mycena amicta]